MFCSFSLQMWEDSEVECLSAPLVKLCRCCPYLVLKGFAVSPMYDASDVAVVTLHLYTTLGVRHLPSSGQVVWSLQLQFGTTRPSPNRS